VCEYLSSILADIQPAIAFHRRFRHSGLTQRRDERVPKIMQPAPHARSRAAGHYTVRNHVNHITVELQVSDRTEAATVAMRQGVIDAG
jgi:hypothetical protein